MSQLIKYIADALTLRLDFVYLQTTVNKERSSGLMFSFVSFGGAIKKIREFN